jgi:hypothetical protein
MLGVEGPMPVPPEIVHHRNAEGEDRRRDVVDVERPDEDRKHGEVDDVSRRSHQAELKELDPVARLQGPAADALGGLYRSHP